MATITAFKCTRANGRDFHSNSVTYAVGSTVEVANPDISNAPCGRGLHCSPTAKLTCQYGARHIDRGRWRWFEVQFDEADLLGKDESKYRVRKLTVIRELTLVDVFGYDLRDRVVKMNEQVETWKSIPWCKPAKEITEEDLKPHLARLHEALTFWLARRGGNRALPRAARIVRDAAGAISAAKSLAAAADAAAAAAADADAAAAADADAAAAAAADADAAAAAAAAADAADAAAAAAAAAADARWPYYYWYLRPRWVLRRAAWWTLGAMSEPSIDEALIAIYRLGAWPIGYCRVDGEIAFVVYCPPPVAAAKEAA